jgi:hypothetical protein
LGFFFFEKNSPVSGWQCHFCRPANSEHDRPEHRKPTDDNGDRKKSIMTVRALRCAGDTSEIILANAETRQIDARFR